MVMRPSPALLAFVEMLALPALALDELVERELADNPALERDDERGTWKEPDDVAAGTSGRDELLADVTAVLPEHDRRVAEYVVGSLDERGFLDADLHELAHAIGVDVARVERVVQAVRDAGPPGVGARDVRQSLVLQLGLLDGSPVVELARRVVEWHLEDLAYGRDDAIAAALGVTPDEVAGARELIRSRLRPYADLGAPSSPPPVVADVIVTERPDESGAYDVELPEAERYGLALSPLYELLARDGDALSAAERARVVAQVAQARAFIERVERRRATLSRVARLVVAQQAAFLRNGTAALVPLTRAEVAEELGLHESTVCRTVAGRYVRLPGGRIVAFADFFRRSLGAEEALSQLVAAEGRPRSDTELVEELAARGFRIARRTVAKYRDRLGILPYALR
jgi:RNA polymerase sigma-54 factor